MPPQPASIWPPRAVPVLEHLPWAGMLRLAPVGSPVVRMPVLKGTEPSERRKGPNSANRPLRMQPSQRS